MPYPESSAPLCACGCGQPVEWSRSRKSFPRFAKNHSGRYHWHGRTNTPEWRAWTGMWTRCTNPKSNVWERYGGRGITIDERWRDFRAFLADMGPRPSRDHSVDRIDNNRGYGPDNCRWATRSEQASNRRSGRWLTFNGETRTLTDWANKIGISKVSLSGRLRRGWSVEAALTTPPESHDSPPCHCGQPHKARGLCLHHYYQWRWQQKLRARRHDQ